MTKEMIMIVSRHICNLYWKSKSEEYFNKELLDGSFQFLSDLTMEFPTIQEEEMAVRLSSRIEQIRDMSGGPPISCCDFCEHAYDKKKDKGRLVCRCPKYPDATKLYADLCFRCNAVGEDIMSHDDSILYREYGIDLSDGLQFFK